MLRLVLGRSGSGKTHRIRALISQAAEQGYDKIYLLVPEQFSFESERALYHELGAQKSLTVEVLSFTRLANLVFRAYGGLSKHYVDDCARRMLMSVALSELQDHLTVYKRHHAAPAFVKNMLTVITEFKNAAVTPHLLQQAGRNAQSEALRAKTDELALIYNAYEALLARGYADPLDDLPAANRLLEQHNLFAGAAFFVDEFKGFTAVELQTLSYVIRGARDCTVALCADSLSDNEQGMGLFSPVISVANTLVRIAKEQGVAVASPERLTSPQRFQTEALCAVEHGLFNFTPQPAACPADGVRVYSAQGPYEELELVAAEITRLVQQEQLRYRDVVVIARDIASYQTALESVFPRYGIPYFFDLTQTIERAPVIACALYAAECAATNLNTDSLLALLKTGLSGLAPIDIADLENYAYVWDIRGGVWRTEFTKNPRGFADELTDADKRRLANLNTLRQTVIPPLAAFADAVREANGGQFARALYRYLLESGAQGAVTRQIELARQQGCHNDAQEHARVWDTLMGILDSFAAVLGAQGMTARRALELLRLAANAYDMGSIPQTLDQVLVGSAERIRAASPKAVFVIGAVEGVFPLNPQGGGLLSDSEREALIEQGLQLSGTRERRAVEERFIAYKALTCGSHTLTVSYPRQGVKGDAFYPSVIVRRLTQLFEGLPVRDAASLGEEAYIVNDTTVLSAAARHGAKETPFTAALHELIADQKRSDALCTGKTPFAIGDEKVARALFGEELVLSPTGLETFYRCRFSYFLRYGIRLKKREKARLSPLEAGSLIHYALQQLLAQHSVAQLNDMTAAVRRKLIHALLTDYLNTHMGGKEDKPARFAYLFGRLASTVERLIGQLIAELMHSEFVPDAFELPIKKGEEVEPVALVTPTGARVMVQGQVDRVDVMTKNGKRYIRVVDYKSGAKTFHLSDVYYGLNMQMLLYLFTLSASERYQNSIAAGVLYMPAQNPIADVLRDTDERELKQKQTEQLRMNGLLIDDPEVLLGMEKEGRGVFIPAKVVKTTAADGTEQYEVDKRSKVASLENMGRLHRHINRLVEDMAGALHGGDIDAVPVLGADYTPCSYCEFSHVCGHEDGDAVTEIQSIPSQELFARMEVETHGTQLDTGAAKRNYSAWR